WQRGSSVTPIYRPDRFPFVLEWRRTLTSIILDHRPNPTDDTDYLACRPGKLTADTSGALTKIPFKRVHGDDPIPHLAHHHDDAGIFLSQALRQLLRVFPFFDPSSDIFFKMMDPAAAENLLKGAASSIQKFLLGNPAQMG